MTLGFACIGVYKMFAEVIRTVSIDWTYTIVGTLALIIISYWVSWMFPKKRRR